MSGNWIGVAGLLLLAVSLSAVRRALLSVSRSALERRLAGQGKPEAAAWLFEGGQDAHLSLSLVLIATRVCVVVLTLRGLGLLEASTDTPWWHWLVTISVLILTLWLLAAVLGGAIARYTSEAIVAAAMGPVRVLTTLCVPLNRGFHFVDEAVRRLTGANLREADQAEDLLRSIEDSKREGELSDQDVELLENVVEFSTTDVGEVMTPRTDIDGFELSDDLSEIKAFLIEAGHSRIPVFRENLDSIVGILHVKDLLRYLGEETDGFELEPILRTPQFVPDTKSVRDLLSDFQESETHMAIVVDEYGGTQGLVTIEDVLEEIVGEIHDEHDDDDQEEPTLDVIDGTHAEVDGRFHIDDLNERLGLVLPEDDEYDTVGGFMLSQLGRVPGMGESIESHDARFTAIAATPTHIKRIAIELLGSDAANGQPNGHG